jgi:hypothetical protein
MSAALLAFLIAIKPFVFGGVQPPGATLVVETSQVHESGAGPAIARQIRRSGAQVLGASDTGGPSDLVVTVKVRTLRGPAIGYVSTVALHQAGRQVAMSRQRCSLCTEGEVVSEVQRSLVRLAPTVQALARGG